VRSLRVMYVSIDDSTVVIKIVSELPVAYQAVKPALRSVPETGQTMAALLARQKLEQLELKQKAQEGNKEVPANAYHTKQFGKFPGNKRGPGNTGERKKAIECFICGKKYIVAGSGENLNASTTNCNVSFKFFKTNDCSRGI